MSHSCCYYYTNPPSHYPPGALRTFAVPRVHTISSTAACVEKVSPPQPDDNPHPHQDPQNDSEDKSSGNNNSGSSGEDKASVIAKLRRELQSLLRKNAELERELRYQRSKLQAADSANALLEAKNLLLRGELQTTLVGCGAGETVFGGGGGAKGYWRRRRRGSLDSQDSWCWGDDDEDE